MRVVIVGGAGFIGTSLARSLSRHGHHPVVLDTPARLAGAAAALGGASTAEFDFTSARNAEALLAGADGLVHLACTTNPAHSMARIAWDAESNIAPSLRLFDAALAAGVPRVVFASSGGTVYGAPERLPVRESDPTRPLSAYGVSKLAIENYLALYPLNGISLRLANPYGVGQLSGATVGVIARYAMAVGLGQSLEVWGDGSVVRDYVAIEDVADAFRLALETRELPSGAYNIGTGIGASVNDVIAAVFAAAGRTVPVAYKPARAYDVPAIILDSARFGERTGWVPAMALETGINALWARCAPATNQSSEAGNPT